MDDDDKDKSKMVNHTDIKTCCIHKNNYIKKGERYFLFLFSMRNLSPKIVGEIRTQPIDAHGIVNHNPICYKKLL